MLSTLIARLLYAIIFLLSKTYRIKWINPELKLKARAMHPSGAIAIAFYHEDIVGALLSHRGTPKGIFCPLISSSKDGEIAAKVCSYVGYSPIRGSSRNRSAQAWEELKRAIFNEGKSLAFPIDGPIGPRRKAKPGIARISQKGQVAILPLKPEPEHYWTLNSWDKFRIPKPFTKFVMRYADPFIVPEGVEGETFEHYLTKLSHSLDSEEEKAQNDFLQWSQRASKKPIF